MIRHLYDRLELQNRSLKLQEEMQAQRRFLEQYARLIQQIQPHADGAEREEWLRFRDGWERRLHALDSL